MNQFVILLIFIFFGFTNKRSSRLRIGHVEERVVERKADCKLTNLKEQQTTKRKKPKISYVKKHI